MKRLLLIEDEEVILKALTRLLERNHYEVTAAVTVEQAIEAQPQSFDLVLADLRLPGAEGTAIIPVADPVPVVIMTSHASVRSAVDAMRHGAIDYIAKPFDHDELLMVIERSLMQNLLQAQNLSLRLDVQRTHPLKCHFSGTTFEHFLENFRTVRDSQRCFHLYGETGTDREGLARAMHLVSDRGDAPFVVADSAAYTGSTAQTALMGSSGKLPPDRLPPGGLLHAAHNGTLVLRHPETLSADIQRQVSGVLTMGRMRLPESGRQRAINVRVVTIAQQTIEVLLDQKLLVPEMAELFISDQFEVPALRNRREDILPLARQELASLAIRHAKGPLRLTRDAELALLANDWPGNVAELDCVLGRAVLGGRNNNVTLDDVGFAQSSSGARDLSLDEYFRYVVLRNQIALSETELAARLGISRKALWERRQRMQLLRDSNLDLSS